MDDGQLILKFLEKNYKDDHPAVYLYCVGKRYSPQTGSLNIFREVKDIFCPPISQHYLEVIIKAFLENKKKLYLKGEIKVKPIYGD